MPRSERLRERRQRLREAIRDVIAAQGGDGRPRDVALKVREMMSDLVAEMAADLSLSALTSLARKEFKAWIAVGTASRAQVPLPGFAAHLLPELPASLCVPGGSGEAGDQEFRALSHITTGEAKAALLMLEQGIAADARKARAIRELVRIAGSVGAADGEMLVDALRRAAEAA